MNTFGRIMEKYGESTKIEWEGCTQTAKTFIQPAIKSGSDKITHLGRVDDGEYYWFAPSDVVLDRSRRITVCASGGEFDLVKAEKFRAFGKESHWEGILKRRF